MSIDNEASQLPVSPFAEDTADEMETEVWEPEGEDPIEESEDELEEHDDLEESDDELEESDDEAEEESELTDEELDELLAELEEEDEEEDQVDVVPHAALHKERERRKEVQAELVEQQQMLEEANSTVKEYKDALEDIKAQLKELDLEDVVNIRAPKEVPEEVLELRQQQAAERQQQQVVELVNDLRSEAVQHIEEFPQIDGNDPEQAELILGFAMASTMLGADKEDAILKAMGILNKHLASAKKAAKRPVARKVTKPARAAKRRKASSTSRAIKKGDVRSVFDSYAEEMVN